MQECCRCGRASATLASGRPRLSWRIWRVCEFSRPPPSTKNPAEAGSFVSAMSCPLEAIPGRTALAISAYPHWAELPQAARASFEIVGVMPQSR